VSRENKTKIPRLASSKKHSSKNTMKKQANSPMHSAGIDEKTQRIRLLKDNGKRRIQICFRITEKAWDRLQELSALFEMKDTDYVKAVLYKELGIWTERLDYRKKRRFRK